MRTRGRPATIAPEATGRKPYVAGADHPERNLPRRSTPFKRTNRVGIVVSMSAFENPGEQVGRSGLRRPQLFIADRPTAAADPKQPARLPGSSRSMIPFSWRPRGVMQVPRTMPNVHHWITLSARCSSDCGIVTPSAFAVVKLINSSNLVGCSTGIFAGFAPLRILSTKLAAARQCHSLDER